MLFEYVRFPKIISEDQYELDKNNFLDYEVVNKNNGITLIESNVFNDNPFWLITDIGLIIRKKYNNRIFLFCDIEDNEVQIIIGNSYDPLNTNFVNKISFNINNIKEKTKEINLKLDFLKNFFNDNNDILVFSTNSECRGVLDTVLANKDYVQEDLVEIVNSSKIYKETKQIIKPYLVVFMIFVLLSYFSGLLVDNYSKDIVDTNKNKETKLKRSLKLEEIKSTELLKKIAELEKQIGSIDKVQNKIYKK